MCNYPIDVDGPAPDQTPYDQSLFRRNPLDKDQFVADLTKTMICVLNRLGFWDKGTPVGVLTKSGWYDRNNSWGAIDVTQLKACVREEVSILVR